MILRLVITENLNKVFIELSIVAAQYSMWMSVHALIHVFSSNGNTQSIYGKIDIMGRSVLILKKIKTPVFTLVTVHRVGDEVARGITHTACTSPL